MHSDKWRRGRVLAEAQNFARDLMESPANHMTPTKFVETVSNKLGGVRLGLNNPGVLQIIPRLDIYCLTPMTPTPFLHTLGTHVPHTCMSTHTHTHTHTRPLSWIQSKKMGAFLSIAQGSAEEPWLLEMRYNCDRQEEASTEQPTVLVGKGVSCCGRITSCIARLDPV